MPRWRARWACDGEGAEGAEEEPLATMQCNPNPNPNPKNLTLTLTLTLTISLGDHRLGSGAECARDGLNAQVCAYLRSCARERQFWLTLCGQE